MVIAVAMMCSLVLTLTACNLGGSTNDTFAGKISSESFETEEDAVKGFLSTELSGEAASANFVSYEAKKELSIVEIGNLELGDVTKESIVSAKEVSVSYTHGEVKRTADAEEDYFVYTVYILEISKDGAEVHEFRYYVPKAKSGDALTKSYYDDLLSPAKYANCTQQYTSNMTMVMSSGGEQVTLPYELKYVIKVAGNKATIEMRNIDMNALMENMEIKYIDMKGYFEYDASTKEFKAYMSVGDSSYTADAQNAFAQYGVTDMDSFVTMNFPKVDYSFYEKTDFGFKIQEEFLNKYLSLAVANYVEGSDVSCSLNIYVTDGRVDKMESSTSISFTSGSISSKTTNVETLIFKDFGTTVVETPDLA